MTRAQIAVVPVSSATIVSGGLSSRQGDGSADLEKPCANAVPDKKAGST